ncbi:MAG: serine/threonine protein kinase [Kofleriaceae bacterium]|nr:serine/threonine protein kinase [Kofleriaceae bacterium]
MHARVYDLDTSSDVLSGGALYCPTCGDSYSSLCERCPDDGSQLVAYPITNDPLIGALLDGRFRILQLLAEGAMGRVYEGVQLPVKRPVAIKVMREEFCGDPTTTQRFHREAQLLTRIAHPNIVDVFDYGETDDGSFYIVMELLRGNTLDAILANAGTFSVRRTCEVGLQLADALAAAHAQGVVHRDLKPANIILLAALGDWVKVFDLGLAKAARNEPDAGLTNAGAVLGTPLYMAPEQIRYNATDPRSDLYALGCILHELLTGRPPFDGATSNLVLVRQLNDPPPELPESVPAPLRELIGRLLAKNPDERPASALEVRGHLEARLAAELGSDEVLTLTHAALPTVIKA